MTVVRFQPWSPEQQTRLKFSHTLSSASLLMIFFLTFIYMYTYYSLCPQNKKILSMCEYVEVVKKFASLIVYASARTRFQNTTALKLLEYRPLSAITSYVRVFQLRSHRLCEILLYIQIETLVNSFCKFHRTSAVAIPSMLYQ